jgi:perosamine synthetase
MFDPIIQFIQRLYPEEHPIFLHRPHFTKIEEEYLSRCIQSNVVSTVGTLVEQLEKTIAHITESKHAVAMNSGTSGLHLALLVAGVQQGDEVITQSLSFVAPANAISYLGASPIFLDTDSDTLGLSPDSLKAFLSENATASKKGCFNKLTGNKICACIPVHNLGIPCRIDEIVAICNEYSIPVIEDAAEALGSRYKDKPVGSFGSMGVLSFNGNKIITGGAGGMVVTNNPEHASRLMHLSTTAKVKHSHVNLHDEVGYNYRMPNINAALLLAQCERFSEILSQKQAVAKQYEDFINDWSENTVLEYLGQPPHALSNAWLNGLKFNNQKTRTEFLDTCSEHHIEARSMWQLVSEFSMYQNAYRDDLTNTRHLSETIALLPSSVRYEK